MARGSNVVPLRLTASVATRRIRGLMRKSGVIFLTPEARLQLLESGVTYPQLVTLLATGTVKEAPQPTDAFPGAWRCCVEGVVKVLIHGARVELVLQATRVVIERVRLI